MKSNVIKFFKKYQKRSTNSLTRPLNYTNPKEKSCKLKELLMLGIFGTWVGKSIV
jgi:hypothetical protein